MRKPPTLYANGLRGAIRMGGWRIPLLTQDLENCAKCCTVSNLLIILMGYRSRNLLRIVLFYYQRIA